ncbi:site-specific DNA-methyltransferase, partial [bacterium]|nr:site-specific DNA-methyltransferase [bacterium]
KNVLEMTLSGKRLNPKYQFLPIDTKYFKDLELEILGLFDDLDNSLDGWLIKSENYQALNTILPKFREKVQTIYIDPPYNTGSDEFLYIDKYQSSSWLTMMENRLNLAKELMRGDGVIFISIGDTVKSNIRVTSTSKLVSLLDNVFNEYNFIALLVRKSGIAPRQDIKHIAIAHDFVVCYGKNFDLAKINKRPASSERYKMVDEYIETRGKFALNKLDRGSIHYSPDLVYPIIAPDGTEIWPGGEKGGRKGWTWRWSKGKVEWGIKNGFIVFRKGKNGNWSVYFKEYEFVDNEGNPKERTNPYDTFIMEATNEKGNEDIENLFRERLFEYPKPVLLLELLLRIGCTNNSIILDFFAGSGTTAHAVMKLNKEDGGKRKFILVEMADYFYKVIIPRLKKIAYSFSWKDGKPQVNDGIGIFLKYYELEQYEDTLRKVKYEDSDLFENPYADPYNQYIFMKDLKMLSALEIDYENNKVKVDLEKLYPNIDIAETLSNLLGKWIKKITPEWVEFEDGERINIKNLDYKLIKPLIWW